MKTTIFNVVLDLLQTYLYSYLDDEDKIREELKDLIDDNPIEEESDSGSDSDDSRGNNFTSSVK